MTPTPDIDPVSGAPRDYEALFRHYRGFVAKIVRTGGVPDQEVEDVVQEILMSFMAKKSLENYSYHRLHDTHRPRQLGDSLPLDRSGQRFRPAKFSSYLRQFVFLNSLHHRDKVIRDSRREPVIADAPLTADSSTTLVQNMSPTVGFEDDLVTSHSLNKIFSSVSSNQSGGRVWTVGETFTACLISYEESGKVDRAVVADLLGVSQSSVRYMLKAVRSALEDAGATSVVVRP